MSHVVRKTKLAACEIITVRLSDPFALHPFVTFALADNACGPVSHFSCEARALHFHDCLIKRMSKLVQR